MNEMELHRRLRGLAVDQPPSRDLWPGIQQRLPARQRRRVPTWPAAVAAALLLATGLLWWQPLQSPDAETSLGGPDLAVAETVADVEDAAETLLLAWTELLEFERKEPEWVLAGVDRPGGVERYAAARELDASLAQLAAALRVEPDSQLIRRLLHQTLRQRIALSQDRLSA